MSFNPRNSLTIRQKWRIVVLVLECFWKGSLMSNRLSTLLLISSVVTMISCVNWKIVNSVKVQATVIEKYFDVEIIYSDPLITGPRHNLSVDYMGISSTFRVTYDLYKQTKPGDKVSCLLITYKYSNGQLESNLENCSNGYQ